MKKDQIVENILRRVSNKSYTTDSAVYNTARKALMKLSYNELHALYAMTL